MAPLKAFSDIKMADVDARLAEEIQNRSTIIYMIRV